MIINSSTMSVLGVVIEGQSGDVVSCMRAGFVLGNEKSSARTELVLGDVISGVNTGFCRPVLEAPVAEARAWVGIGSWRTQWCGGGRLAGRGPCWG